MALGSPSLSCVRQDNRKGGIVIGVAVVIAVLTVCCAVAVLLTLRVDAQMRARIDAMPGGDEPAAAWPINVDDESAGPYLRGATVAAGLTGRR